MKKKRIKTRGKTISRHAESPQPTQLAQMITKNLNAATATYHARIREINTPVIDLLQTLCQQVPLNGLINFLSTRRLSEIASEDFRIIGEIWEQVRSGDIKKNGITALPAWDELIAIINERSDNDQVKSLRKFGAAQQAGDRTAQHSAINNAIKDDKAQ
jgi:hypothetical protein